VLAHRKWNRGFFFLNLVSVFYLQFLSEFSLLMDLKFLSEGFVLMGENRLTEEHP
jgi:hypothetical protein